MTRRERGQPDRDGADEAVPPTPGATSGLERARPRSASLIPTVVVVGIFAVLTNHAADPLSNTDTYFHLRFGHEFLTGNWSLTRSRAA